MKNTFLKKKAVLNCFLISYFDSIHFTEKNIIKFRAQNTYLLFAKNQNEIFSCIEPNTLET